MTGLFSEVFLSALLFAQLGVFLVLEAFLQFGEPFGIDALLGGLFAERFNDRILVLRLGGG